MDHAQGNSVAAALWRIAHALEAMTAMQYRESTRYQIPDIDDDPEDVDYVLLSDTCIDVADQWAESMRRILLARMRRNMASKEQEEA